MYLGGVCVNSDYGFWNSITDNLNDWQTGNLPGTCEKHRKIFKIFTSQVDPLLIYWEKHFWLRKGSKFDWDFLPDLLSYGLTSRPNSRKVLEFPLKSRECNQHHGDVARNVLKLSENWDDCWTAPMNCGPMKRRKKFDDELFKCYEILIIMKGSLTWRMRWFF